MEYFSQGGISEGVYKSGANHIGSRAVPTSLILSSAEKDKIFFFPRKRNQTGEANFIAYVDDELYMLASRIAAYAPGKLKFMITPDLSFHSFTSYRLRLLETPSHITSPPHDKFQPYLDARDQGLDLLCG